MQARLVTLLAIVMLGAAGVVPMAIAADPAPAASTESMSQADLLARLGRKDPDLVVLDVRTPAEFAAGHVPGARNVSHDLLSSRLAELAPLRDKQVVLYCRSGRRTLLAADVLHAAGFTRLAHLEGDYLAWEAEHRPIER
jgi:rhodanese-related sulfurtransferase